MSIATQVPAQPDEPWYTARQIAEAFPAVFGGLDEMSLQRLATLAKGIARGCGIAPRWVQQPNHRYHSVSVHAYPRSIWAQARGRTPAPEGLEPVPTVFNGTRYRSRLEARTAVWLTSMGWEFEYEPQHYELPSGPYLPDFRVMFGDDWTWFEVKSPHTLPRDRDPRWSECVLRTNCDLVVMYGLWRPVPFSDSGPARMFRGAKSGAYEVHWSEVTRLYPQGAANPFFAQRLLKAYRAAADERFGEDDGLSFAV